MPFLTAAFPAFLIVAIFDPATLPVLVAAFVAILVVIITTYLGSRGEGFKLREIAGLKAVEEAIGRATEMARPVLFTPGWGGDIQRRRRLPL